MDYANFLTPDNAYIINTSNCMVLSTINDNFDEW